MVSSGLTSDRLRFKFRLSNGTDYSLDANPANLSYAMNVHNVTTAELRLTNVLPLLHNSRVVCYVDGAPNVTAERLFRVGSKCRLLCWIFVENKNNIYLPIF